MTPNFPVVFTALFLCLPGLGTAQSIAAEDPDPPASGAPAPMDDSDLLVLDARAIDVREYVWNHRLLVVMADTPQNPQFDRQLEAIQERPDDFVTRDVVVIFDAHPADESPLRQVLRPNGFMTAIIDKDGEVKARRPAVRSARELIAVIDKFPLRRQEMLEQRPSGR